VNSLDSLVPVTVAVTATAPVSVATAVAVAIPLEFVSAVAGETVSPVPTNETGMPSTSLPVELLTMTVNGLGSNIPGCPVWPLPDSIAIEAAVPGATTVSVPGTKTKP
jgi:hypothetical protein